jgi:hypothetical protein
MKLSSKEKDRILFAISMWKNYIETNDVTLSGKDVESILRSGEKSIGGKKLKLKSLGREQRKLLQELDDIEDKLRKS